MALSQAKQRALRGMNHPLLSRHHDSVDSPVASDRIIDNRRKFHTEWNRHFYSVIARIVSGAAVKPPTPRSESLPSVQTNPVTYKPMNKERRNKISKHVQSLQAIRSGLEDIQSEEQNAFDNLPEGLQQAEVGLTSETAIDLLSNAVGEMESVISILEEIE
jgi:hypothetical protein